MGRPFHHSLPHWAVGAAVLLGLVAYWTTLQAGVKVWSSSPDEQHGFLVIPVALVLLYLRRGAFPGTPSGIDLRGLFLLAIAAALRIYSEQYIRPWMDIWSLPLWVGGIVWTLGGWRVFRWAAPAIAFLFFMAPLPGQIQTAAGYPLQVIAATGGGWLLQMIGQPAFVAGTTILLGDNNLDVERACSGLRMFHGMLAVAVAWSLFARYSWPRFLVLLTLAPLIAVLVNILRIAATGLLFQYVSGDAAQAFTHDWAGLLMIPTGAFIFFVIDSFFDYLGRWNRERPDRWLMTAATAMVVVLLLGGASYAIHARQQERAIELVLKQARDLLRGESTKDQVAAAGLFQRYLSVRQDDAAVIAELAAVHAGLGQEHWRRAARLYELAWRADSSRQEDALTSLLLLRQLAAWQPLWEQSNSLIPRLGGSAQITALRLRTLATTQLTSGGSLTADIDKMFAGCREGIKLDEGHFEHTWQLASLTRLQPSRARIEDIAPAAALTASTSAADASTSQQEAARQSELLIKALTDASGKALAIVDHYIARHPDQARPQLYRVALLQSIRGEVVDVQQQELVENAITASLDRALQLVGVRYPLSGELTAVATAPGGQDLDSDGSATAAYAYLVAGTRALRDGNTEQAQRYLSRSQSLGPQNYQVYLLLAEMLPRDATDKQIELFKTALQQTGTRELTLILPLAEAYIAAGRETDAEALLKPLETLLPSLAGVDRGRVELMLASTRASGLAQQGRIRPAVDVLATAVRQQAVVSQRRNFAALYARAQFQLGSLYRSLSQEAAAAAAFQEGGRFDPESPIWHFDAARAYEATGNLPAALEQYRRAAAIVGRQQPDIYLSIANVLLAEQRQASPAQRKMEEARSMIRVAISRGANIGTASSLLAESFVIEDDLAAAFRVVDEQLAKTPDAVQLIFSRAIIREMSGDVEAALEDVARYRTAGASASDALLLQVLILDRAGRLDEAIALVNRVAERFSDVDMRIIRTQLAVALFRRGDVEQGTDRLKQLAITYPDELSVQQLAADLFADLRLDSEAEQVEQNLRRLEGDSGTLWRASRAARLLRPPSTPQQVREAEQLVARLEQLLPQWPRTATLRGQIAEGQGRWPEALAAYESAWSAGMRDAALAVRILTALSRTGQNHRAVEYVNQLEDLVPSSTSLFDRAMPQYVSGDRSDYVLQLARHWAESDPTPDNLVRLGQTLMAIAGSARFQSDPASASASIDEAERAFETAIEDDPENLSAWIASFQLQAELRQDRDGAIQKLQQLSQQLQIDPLQRSFVLAQLYSIIGEGARAGQEFDRAIELSRELEPQQRHGVALTAANFFAPRRYDRALLLCRQVVEENPESEAGKAFLFALLASQNTLASVDEAIQLQPALTSDTQGGTVDGKRQQARLLAQRASISNPSGPPRPNRLRSSSGAMAQIPDGPAPVDGGNQAKRSTAQQDRLAARTLMESISPRTADDAALLAELHWMTGLPLQAFNAYRESLRLEVPTPERLISFLDFWNQFYAAEGTYRPVADQCLKDLQAFPQAAPQWLRISLDRAGIEQVKRSTPEVITASATSAITPTAARGETTRLDSQAARSPADTDQAILAAFHQSFIPPSTDGDFEIGISQLAEGLADAKRLDLLPAALEMIQSSRPRLPQIGSALAVATIRLTLRQTDTAAVVTALLERMPASSSLSVGLLNSIGDAMYVSGNLESAVRYYRQSLEQVPDDLHALNSLAIVLADSGQSQDEAMRLVNRTLELEPDSADRRDTKLVVAMLIDDWDTAATVAETLTDQRSGLVLLHLAFLSNHQGHSDEAKKLFDQSRDANVQTQLFAPCDKTMYQTLSKQLTSSPQS